MKSDDVRHVDAHYQCGATVSDPINLDPPIKPGDTLMVAHHFHPDDERFAEVRRCKDSMYSITRESTIAYIDVGANDMNIERPEDEIRKSHEEMANRFRELIKQRRASTFLTACDSDRLQGSDIEFKTQEPHGGWYGSRKGKS